MSFRPSSGRGKQRRGGIWTIEGVFGASGTLAGQINLGAPADIAVLQQRRARELAEGRETRAARTASR